ncbi:MULTISPECIES: hypothetical protein [Bacillus cereus group]|uniref:hypothetical protein n=1 Tax=Bacillus cereus group TaxID=86661 RepID=UPI000676B911|nr:hypothetical protein [Bacillus thuringiensis]AKR09568.1 hypothetical protein AC241_12820 [Bacillus thuringiensis]
MPNTDVKRIYDLLHSPVLTPYNLLENVKLDNYFYVNYYKNEIGIVCEMKCTVKDGSDLLYFYHFDKNDCLVKVYMQDSNDAKVLIFDREQELNNEINKHIRKNMQKTVAI